MSEAASDVDRETVKLLAKLLVSGTLLALVFYFAGPRRVFDVLSDVDVRYFAVALAISLFGVAVSTKRWQLLLRSKGESIAFSKVFRIYYIGAFSNLFLPSSIGGDVVKSTIMARQTDESVEAYASVILNRFCGLVALVTFAATAILLRPELLNPRISESVALVILAVLVVPLLFLVTRQFGRRSSGIERLTEFGPVKKVALLGRALRAYADDKRILAAVMLLAFLFQASVVVTHYVIALAVGLHIPLSYLLVAVPLIELLLLAPISIHGHGVREALFVFFYSEVGVPSARAVGFSLTLYVMVLILYSIGLPFLGVSSADLRRG